MQQATEALVPLEGVPAEEDPDLVTQASFENVERQPVVKLNVDVTAPSVVIPLKANEQGCFALDLGHGQAMSSKTMLTASETQVPYVHYTATLGGLSLFRATTKQDEAQGDALVAVEFVDKYEIVTMTTLQAGAEIKQPLVSDWAGQSSEAALPMALQLAERSTVEHARDVFVGASIGTLKLTLGAQDYSNIMNLASHVSSSLEVLDVLDDSGSDTTSLGSDSNFDSLSLVSDIDDTDTNHDEEDTVRAAPLLNGPAASTMMARFHLGLIELKLYNEPLGTPAAQAHNEKFLLTQGQFLKLDAGFETDNDREDALLATARLQQIKLVDMRNQSRTNHFATVLATSSGQEEDEDACLEVTLQGRRQSVTYVTSDSVDLADSTWQKRLGQHGNMQHLYVQEGSPFGARVAVVEYGEYNEAQAALTMLKEDVQVTDVRFGPAMRAKADAKFRGLELVLAPEYIAALLEFALAPFVADESLLVEAEEATAQPQAATAAVSTEVRVVVKDVLSEEQAYLMMPTMMERLHAQARIEHPTIVVVEDPYDPNTRALSFDVVVKVDFQSSQDVMHMFASVTEATLVSQLWNRPSTQMQVLEPLDLTLQYRETDEHVKAHTVVDKVVINLAYADVQFVTLFAQKIAEPFEALSRGKRETPTALPPGAIPAIKWDQLPVPANKKRHRRADNVVRANASSAKTETLQASIPIVDITLINTMYKQLSPLLTLSASLDLNLQNWSQNVSGDAFVSVAAAMLDPRFTAWEPLLVGGDANSQLPQPFQLHAQVSSAEVKKMNMGIVRIAQESGHHRTKLGERTGAAARVMLAPDKTFWAGKPRRSRHPCKVVFDMQSTVRLKRFFFRGLGLADHAPRTSSLHVADNVKGPWKHVCDVASPNSMELLSSPEFRAAGRFWSWTIKNCHGSNQGPYVERVDFEKVGGGISVACQALERLDLTVTSNVVSRLVSISTEWLADLNQLRQARNATSTSIPTRIGLYQLSNQTGHAIAYQAAPHYDAHYAQRQRVEIGQAQVFDLEVERDMGLVAAESELNNLTNVSADKPIRNVVVFNASENQHAPKGYVTVQKNLNEDTGDDVIYLAYTTEGTKEPITDVAIIWTGKRGTGRDPKVGVPEAVPSDWEALPVELNSDRDHLRHVRFALRRGQGAPIVGLTVIFTEKGKGSSNEVLPEGYHLVPKDMNRGHRNNSIYPYIAYKRAAAVDVLSQPMLRDPSAPMQPITDIRIISMRKPSKTGLTAPDDTIKNWSVLNDSSGMLNLNAKSGGNATYLMYARDPTRAPITGLALYGSPTEKVHAEWTTEGINLNEGGKANALWLYLQRSPGAAPITDLATLIGDVETPEVFVLTPELNVGYKDLFRNTSLYLAYTVGTRNPVSFTVTAMTSHRQATRAKSVRARDDDAGPQRTSDVRTELKAIQHLRSGSKSAAISFEVKGWLPLENVAVDQTGESTYLMRKVGMNRYDRITVHVLIRNDVKTIVLRSPLHCINDFDIPLHVTCHSHLTEDKPQITLQPGDEFSPTLGLLDDPPAGAHVQPLYRFWSPVKERHFVSNNPADALALHSSYIVEAILGYVFISPFEGTVPLWASRCDTHRTRFAVFTNRSESDRKVSLGTVLAVLSATSFWAAAWCIATGSYYLTCVL